MRVHAAFWVFAKTHGSIYAQRYAVLRTAMTGDDLVNADNEWLRGRGGLNLRDKWKTLSDAERVVLLESTPDNNYPYGGCGIMDERRLKKFSRGVNATERTQDGGHFVEPQYPPGNVKRMKVLGKRTAERFEVTENLVACEKAQAETRTRSDHATLEPKLKRLRQARSRYYDGRMMEELLRVQVHYNRGSLADVIAATTSAVESAVQLSRSKGNALTPEEAYQMMDIRVVDVFATLRGMAQFPPEPVYSSDEPSEEFAASRLRKLLDAYRDSVTAVYSSTPPVSTDPDTPLLSAHHLFFGKPNGIPHVSIPSDR